MNALQRNIGPLVHMLVTLPGMVYELICVPLRIRRQEKDWQALVSRYPVFGMFLSEADHIKERLTEPYTVYTRTYSSPLITLSLNRAALLYFIIGQFKPSAILDLGSGISTYVSYSARGREDCTVTTVDSSPFWLSRVRDFLQGYDLNTLTFMTLQEFENQPMPDFELCTLDIGDFALRAKLLPALLERIQLTGGMLFIDDFHVTAYRKYIDGLCKGQGLRVYSLRKVTRRRLSHAAIVLKYVGD